MPSTSRFLRAIALWTVLATVTHLAVQRWFGERPGPGFLPAAVLTAYASYAGTRVFRGRWAPVGAGLGAAALYLALASLGAALLHRVAGGPRPWVPWHQWGPFLVLVALFAALAAGMAYSGRDDAARAGSPPP